MGWNCLWNDTVFILINIIFWYYVRFEHDFVEISAEAHSKDAPTKSTDKAVESGPSLPAQTVWNAKVNYEDN